MVLYRSADADGDIITVANDSDLVEAIAWATGPLKLRVCHDVSRARGAPVNLRRLSAKVGMLTIEGM